MATSMTVVTCKLCFKFFSDPRMLPCLHSFCYDCLQDYFKKQKSKKYLCPTCHQSCEITSGGDVDGLPKDLHGSYEAEVARYEVKVKKNSTVKCDRCISSSERMAVKFCCNCCKFLCSRCTEDHTQCLETHTHELVTIGKNSDLKESKLKNIPHKVMNCSVHADEVLKFYCETCSELVCRDCVVLLHKEHKFDRIEKNFEKEKESLKSILIKINSSTSKLEQAMSNGEKVVQNVQKRQKTVEKEIEKHFQDLQAALTERKKQLLSKASEIGLEKTTALQLQKEKAKELYDEMSNASSKIADALEIYTPTELLSVKGTMTSKLKALIKFSNGHLLEPCKSNTFPTNLDTAQLKNDIAKFGVITGGCYAGASTAAIYIPQAIKDKEKRITVTARDVQDKPHPYGGEIVSAKLVQLGIDDVSITGKVVDNKDGTYEISITPESIGEHQLKITIENEDIKMSPFIINVREPRNYSSLSNCDFRVPSLKPHRRKPRKIAYNEEMMYTHEDQVPGENVTLYAVRPGEMNFGVPSQPWDVAFGDNEEMFVVDYGYHCIQVKHKANNNFIRTIGIGNGGYGSSEGQFYYPSAIAIKDGVIYVTENSNHRVQKFTTSGKYISKFGTKGSGNGQLSNPRGICLDPEGKIYVSEYNNNRVSVFSADGEFHHYISGSLNNPWAVAFDPQGNLHVVNYGNHSITVFDSSGKYVTQYGSGTLQYPAGIAIDPEGYIFVSEYYYSSGYSCLFMFDPQYKSIHYIQAFQYSVGIALDNDGYIYVCDQNNRRVCKI